MVLIRRSLDGGLLPQIDMDCEPTVTVCPPAPDDFSPLDVIKTLLDIVYWVNRAMPQSTANGWGLGSIAATHGNKQKLLETQIQMPSSTARAVHELVSSALYSAELPITTMSLPNEIDPLLSSIVERTVNNISTVSTVTPASIPISTVTHENSQLIWNDKTHLCSSDADCVAWNIEGAPGPLPVYAAPGTDRKDVLLPAFCLLCIRADAASVCRIASRIGRATPYAFGMSPCILPAFQNLVNCADGYYEEALGVTPNQDIMSPISIASASIPMNVIYNSADKVFYIDQSKAIWQPSQKYDNNSLN